MGNGAATAAKADAAAPVDPVDGSALFDACFHGRLAEAQALVADAARGGGAQARWTTEDLSVFGRETAFHAACQNGHLHVAKWLYNDVPESRATVAQESAGKQTPFWAACAEGRLEVAQWLQDSVPEAKACVIAANESGETPLFAACENGHVDVVTWLLQKVPKLRSTITKANKAGETVFWKACSHGHVDVAKCLYGSVPKTRSIVAQANATNVVGERTPFFAACHGGHLEVAQWLYESVPESHSTVTLANKAGFTPFGTACREGRMEVVRWLVSLPPILPELQNVSDKVVRAPAWRRIEPVVTQAVAMRVTKLVLLVKMDSSSSRTPTSRVFEHMPTRVLSEVTTMLTPLE